MAVLYQGSFLTGFTNTVFVEQYYVLGRILTWNENKRTSMWSPHREFTAPETGAGAGEGPVSKEESTVTQLILRPVGLITVPSSEGLVINVVIFHIPKS